MKDDQKELANHLMASATSMLEDADSIAIAGQSPTISEDDQVRHFEQLGQAMHDIGVMTQVVNTLCHSGDQQCSEEI